LAIHAQVSDRRPIGPDPVPFCKLLEVFARKVGSVVGDDGIWHTESINNVQEELDGLLGINRSYRLGLYPFSELVNYDK